MTNTPAAGCRQPVSTRRSASAQRENQHRLLRTISSVFAGGRLVQPATLMAGYGLAGEAARLRTAQIVAAALGWRIFEAYLVQAAAWRRSRWRHCGRSWPGRRHALALAA